MKNRLLVVWWWFLASYLSKSLGQVVFVSVLVEVNRNRKLSAFDVDDRRCLLEQTEIRSEVLHSQGGAHDDQLQRVSFLSKIETFSLAS